MAERSLEDCRILIAEDEYFLADELRTEFSRAGAIVLGPVGTVAAALDLIRSEPRIDAAILDLNLRGEMALPAAELLAERAVPFVFTTGYERSAIPARFAGIVRCEKPLDLRKVTRAIGREIHA